MASESDHIRLANHNHDLLLHLLSDVNTFPDWVATVAFYKAVHIVEAVFAHDKGRHSVSHDDREKSLKSARYRRIFLNYAHLNASSRIARYLECSGAGRFSRFTDYLDGAGVKRLIRKKLHGVEQSALPLLSNTAQADLSLIQPPQFR